MCTSSAVLRAGRSLHWLTYSRFYCASASRKLGNDNELVLERKNQHDVNNSDSIDCRTVAKTLDEFYRQGKLIPVQPSDPRFLQLAVLGHPNAGKSTLINVLAGWRVCSVSSKVHTTQYSTNTCLTINNTQIVFIDTPGSITIKNSRKHHTGPMHTFDPYRSSHEADLIAVVVDVTDSGYRPCVTENVKAVLEKNKSKDTILIMNKTDLIKGKDALFDTAHMLCNGVVDGETFGKERVSILSSNMNYKKHLSKLTQETQEVEKPDAHINEKGWSHFKKIFMISALENKGIEPLVEYLFRMAKNRPWLYHPSVVVDQNPHELAIMVLREKLLDNLPQEIGYLLKLSIVSWQMSESGALCIGMEIKCHKTHLISRVIGTGGKNISKYVDLVRQELTNVFHTDVVVKLSVS